MKSAVKSLQMPLFAESDSGCHELDISSVTPMRSAPLATSHEHIREVLCQALSLNSVQDFLTSFPAPSFAPMLVQSSVASVIDPLQSARSVWHVFKRLSATALSDLSFRVSHKTSGEDVVVWDHHDVCEELFFVTHIASAASDTIDIMMAFVNEVLETMDAYGRLYVLDATSLGSPSLHTDQRLVAYLTEGEVDMLDAVGVTVM